MSRFPQSVRLCGILLSVNFGLVAPVGAQNFVQDYLRQPLGSYSPCDPWQKGHIFRTHTGHDGLYYNCDQEEEKRCSPWIHWPQRPCDDLFSPHRIHAEQKQTVSNAITRWRRGSCQDACHATWGAGYPPGAGYGVEPLRSSRHRNESIFDSAPPLFTPAEEPLDTPSIQPPPAPVPTIELGDARKARVLGLSRVVDLPSTNELKRVPRR